MEEYHKELRHRFEVETKVHHDLIGEYHLPSWDYVFWLEDYVHQLQDASSDNEYEGCSRCGNIIFQENMNTKTCILCGKVKGE